MLKLILLVFLSSNLNCGNIPLACGFIIGGGICYHAVSNVRERNLKERAEAKKTN